MKIDIGDAGGEQDEPRWLLHGFEYTPKDRNWVWKQWWLGWGDHHELKLPGWQYGGMVYYRVKHWGRVWFTSARLTRGRPMRPSEVTLKSDQRH